MLARVLSLICLIALGGCGFHQPNSGIERGGFLPGVYGSHNPLVVPVADREFVWNQIIDEMDDYFKIKREQRVHVVGNVLTEGSIETFPTTGSTILEPWRKDSVSGFERWHSTLQSIRRHAQVRVIPVQVGYQIELAVFKELEDLVQPERATVGSMTLRHDNSPARTDEHGQRLPAGTLGWIPLGRDIALEQRILSNIRARVTNTGPTQPAVPIQADVNVNVVPR